MAGRLDRWERLLERQLAAAPYVLLAISTILSLLTGGRPWITAGLAALAAAWLWLAPRGAVYVAGLVVLIGALCTQGAWFASFFGFTGYLHSWQYLKGKWRFAGVSATAAISVVAYGGGLPEPTPVAILTYLFFTAAIVAGVGLFSFVGEVTAERSDERKHMVTRLEQTMRENAGLQAQLLVQAREAGVLDERQRMAAEIHDTLAQGLTGIITQLQAAKQGQDWHHVDVAVRLARESLAEARRSVNAVGPGQLDTAPLPEALEEIVGQWRELHGTRAEFTVTGTVRPMHPEVEETLLRTAQEALANAAKHANASRVGLTLSYMEDLVTLDVRDDGIGFDPRLTAFGLTAMRKRVDRLAGTLEIESEAGAGTAISASLPAVTRG
ncbi:sensor histidine kinase [Nonomuraea sp. PA05]|uniref:sensor histidine kinase n=1 Tax=Nonomuraea sp. PA05 TaxID=2604466 RepID=UPI0011DBBB37|nr:sensor histidine kinase [Nonomuraea sp. PA05]TYB54748.1 sensor histidine kinase [Nonomuraea sp. PA05]